MAHATGAHGPKTYKIGGAGLSNQESLLRFVNKSPELFEIRLNLAAIT
jgi:hypothetical protein